jgi:hypothetical protein
MHYHPAARTIVSVIAAAFLGGGCSSPGAWSPTVPAAVPSRTGQVLPDRKHKSELLFVSDFLADTVYVFDLSTLVLVNDVSGFDGPRGLCADKRGDVWATNSNDIIKLSRSGKTLQTISAFAANQDPFECAVDPTTGNLAVTTSNSDPEVMIFPHANPSGTPIVITSPSVSAYYYAGYDPHGNLFFDGTTPGNKFILEEVPAGSHSAKTISVTGGTIDSPGTVQFSKYYGQLVVGDQFCSCLYLVVINPSGGVIGGTINLTGANGKAICIMTGGEVLAPKHFIGVYDNCASQTGVASVWKFPAGGIPKANITNVINEPGGAVVSE